MGGWIPRQIRVVHDPHILPVQHNHTMHAGVGGEVGGLHAIALGTACPQASSWAELGRRGALGSKAIRKATGPAARERGGERRQAARDGGVAATDE